ncbi:phosphomannomutase/phosphoglucomutase [Sphingobium indicum]|uniref:Phosphomannomutase n=2 Tax=Sphingobium indicum TaxID=332055 RepID=A0A1L5BSJ5_SPHIB|nr:phosphomannomutase/phosphoglucomutase [Sphingobium indicum]APL95850.1 phosphomannomutase [Sphingobium indicum B90A]KEY98803.1 phosphomannomutase [Sphingomonas sp. BHC-A]NYI22736.1 phosphomannomutase [Sphingobium indicum]RYM02291.1 phosphomannomutase/phosphoglucomutase [Sphingobium indicum]
MAHRFHPTLLREYDIRGVVGRTLGEADGYAVGRSFGTIVRRMGVRRAGGSRVAVGYDGRLSSPALEQAVVQGLQDSGTDVVRIGLGPTPMLYYAEAAFDVDGGVQITGSHNPADHNGFKLVFQHQAFFGADIANLGSMAAAGDWSDGGSGNRGQVETVAVMDRYVARLVQGFDGAAWRIGWDAGNGAAGPVVDKLVKLLPGEHHVLFTQIDGHFPHHHPDPTVEANLADLKALVRAKKLDFGVAFDGDGDRIGVVDGKGRVIWGDQLLGIFAELVLKDRPNATIVADVKASQALFDRIAALGGRALMWKTGHSLIKSKMKEIAAPLGGEMTGHIFLADDYYGFDDGLYAAVRLIRGLTRLGRSVTALRDEMPNMANTPELRFPVADSRKFAVVEEVRARLQALGANVDETDGLRVVTPDGWWLLRASNTQDALVARAEAKDEEGLARLVAQIDAHLADSGVIRISRADS